MNKLKTQIFNLDDCEGKTIEGTSYMDTNFAILFTDNTYIVLHGYANDGWRGSGSIDIEHGKMIPQEFFEGTEAPDEE